ncbi:hypothetical protein [Roseateles chitinivorans]
MSRRRASPGGDCVDMLESFRASRWSRPAAAVLLCGLLLLSFVLAHEV